MKGSQLLRPRSRRECDSESRFPYSAPNVDSKQLFRSIHLKGDRFTAVPASSQEELPTQKSRKSEAVSHNIFAVVADDVSVSLLTFFDS